MIHNIYITHSKINWSLFLIFYIKENLFFLLINQKYGLTASEEEIPFDGGDVAKANIVSTFSWFEYDESEYEFEYESEYNERRVNKLIIFELLRLIKCLLFE